MLVLSVFYFFKILIAVLLQQTKDVPTCILNVICYGFLERKENEKGSIYLQKVVERYILPLYFSITSDANDSLLGCERVAYTNAAISSSLSPSSISITGISTIV